MTNAERFASQIVTSLRHHVTYQQGASICIYAASQNVIRIMTAITEYVAEIEKWGPTDCTTYNTFDLAKQRLYLMYNILIEIRQKEHSHPDCGWIDKDVSGFSKMYYDLELNADDPYLDVTKRDYYNEVSN